MEPLIPSILQFFGQQTVRSDFVLTLVVTFAFFLVRLFFFSAIRHTEQLSEPRELTIRVMARHLFFAAWVVSLLFIWGHQIKDLAFSLAAIAVALVLATKELLMCALGSVLRASADSFSLGDRIEVDGMRGDVVDHGLLGTTVMEIGWGHQRTGRSFVIPNSLMLTQTVINETFTKDYVLHVIRVPMHLNDNWRKAEKVLTEVGYEVCDSYLSEAQRYMGLVSKKNGLKPPSVTPRVSIQLPEPSRLDLLLRLPTLARNKGRIEQEVLHRFFDRFDSDQYLPSEPPPIEYD